jgi:hypothetical protein
MDYSMFSRPLTGVAIGYYPTQVVAHNFGKFGGWDEAPPGPARRFFFLNKTLFSKTS